MNRGTPISLTDEQRAERERRTRSQTLDVRAVRRARIVLLAAVELNFNQVAPGITATASIRSCTRPLFEASSRALGTRIRSPTPADPERKIASAASRYSSSVIDNPI